MFTNELWVYMQEFERKKPHDRYRLYCEENEEDLEKLLQYLYCIDRFFDQKFNLKYIYIVEDNKFINIMRNLGITSVSKKLFLLNRIGYIYYFTCAKKFSWKDEENKQFRINSWGKDYCKIHNIQLIPSQIEILLSSSIEQYTKMAEVIRNKKIKEMEKINKKLPLTIVY